MRFRVDLSVKGIVSYYVDAPDLTQAIEVSIAEFQADKPADGKNLILYGTAVREIEDSPQEVLTVAAGDGPAQKGLTDTSEEVRVVR